MEGAGPDCAPSRASGGHALITDRNPVPTSMFPVLPRAHERRLAPGLLTALAAGLLSASPAAAQTLSLREAVEQALRNNRQLQVERVNPEIQQATLSASRGFYDPLFTAQLDQENAADTGGFDPTNLNNENIFDAESQVTSLGLTGFAPTGLSYTVGGNYAHSSGTRNFLNFDSYRVGTGISLQQPLLRNAWVDQPRWVIQINKQNLRITELGVEFVALTVVNLARQGYFDLVFAWDSLRIQRELLEARQQFVRGADRQVELGTLTAPEVKLARSQLASAQTELIWASNLVATASNNLRTLLGTDATAWSGEPLVPADHPTPLPETLDFQSSWRTGLSRRPDLRQLAVHLESADLTIRFRRNQLFPSLNLIGAYGLRGNDAIQAFPPDVPFASSTAAFNQIWNQDAVNSMIGVLFSVPLTRTAERANFRASKAQRKQAEVIVKQKEELVLREISDAINFARYSFDRTAAARESVTHASAAVQAEEERLRNGNGSIFLVLEAQTDLARARTSEALARRDYQRALSQLYFAEGTLLERDQLVVKVE